MSLTLLIPSILLAAIVIGIQICRRASSVLLYLTLSSTFTAPKAIRNTINFFVEVGGPTLSSFLFTLGYSQQLKYPLDGSCFFAGAGCIIMLVYIESVFLTVQFRGDYGIMTDYQELITDTYQSDNTNMNSYNNYNGSSSYIENGYGHPSISSSPYMRQRPPSSSKMFGSGIDASYLDHHHYHQQSSSSSIPLFREDLLCIPLGR